MLNWELKKDLLLYRLIWDKKASKIFSKSSNWVFFKLYLINTKDKLNAILSSCIKKNGEDYERLFGSSIYETSVKKEIIEKEAKRKLPSNWEKLESIKKSIESYFHFHRLFQKID